MATRPKSEAKSPPTDARGKIVDALMELAAERRFEDISVRDICQGRRRLSCRLSGRLSFEGGRARRFHPPHRSHGSRAGRWGAFRRKFARAAVRRPDAPSGGDGPLSRRPSRSRRMAPARARRGVGDESGGDELDALHARSGWDRSGRRVRRASSSRAWRSPGRASSTFGSTMTNPLCPRPWRNSTASDAW